MYLKLVSALAPAPRLIVKKDKETTSEDRFDNFGARRGGRRGRGGRGRGSGGGGGGDGRGRGGRGRGGARGGRGRGGRGGGGGSGGRGRDPKKEDLDAEMDAYQTSRSNTEGEGKKTTVSGGAGQPTSIPKARPPSDASAESSTNTTANGTEAQEQE
eukprot:TRINITY_DN717_c0_g1_i5.p1 TRINITY_DN717_c0_g1~~TRINITY_DN717_c0_g1_i5.p1  ORF type:complete len:157 (+),score=21.56 TRINITY_DN717_c0_g1_i5:104-574(+)